MGKYKEVACCKCLGELLVLETDSSEYFYCTSCAWAKFGGGDVRIPNATPSGGLGL
jgi:hypothetical protein